MTHFEPWIINDPLRPAMVNSKHLLLAFLHQQYTVRKQLG